MHESTNRQPSLDLYRTFAIVLREGSFSAAARVLGMRQSSVTRHIDVLEVAIGTRLFVRSSRGLVPTDRALGLRRIADDLLEVGAALRRGITGDEDDTSGSVRISAGELVAVEHLPAMLSAIRLRHPHIVPEIVASNEVDNLAGHRADIAVRMVEHVRDGLFVRRCPAIAFGLYADAEYLARRGTPTTIAQLQMHDLIGFDSETPHALQFAERYPPFKRTGRTVRTDNHLVQFAAVRAGLGIGVCQSVLARRHPNVVQVLSGAFEWELPVWIVMHERLRTRARCRVVFDALSEAFQDPM